MAFTRPINERGNVLHFSMFCFIEFNLSKKLYLKSKFFVICMPGYLTILETILEARKSGSISDLSDTSSLFFQFIIYPDTSPKPLMNLSICGIDFSGSDMEMTTSSAYNDIL